MDRALTFLVLGVLASALVSVEARAAEPGVAEAGAVAPVVETPGDGPKVLVTLDTPTGAWLMTARGSGWGSVCRAPCVSRVPRDGEYRVVAPGIRGTGAFSLERAPAQTRLELTPSSDGKLITGSILTYVGAGVILPVGLTVLLVGLLLDEPAPTTIGAVTAGVGGVSVGVGIPLMVSGSRSHVEQRSATSRALGANLTLRF